MTYSDTSPVSIPRAADESLDMNDVQSVIDMIRDMRIWADLDNERALRAICLPVAIRRVRYFDAADGRMVASLSDDGEAVLTAFDIADALTWHVDHRDKRLVSSRVKMLDADTLELWIDLVQEPAEGRIGE